MQSFRRIIVSFHSSRTLPEGQTQIFQQNKQQNKAAEQALSQPRACCSGGLLGLSLAGAVLSPGVWAPRLAVPYMTAATVMGYLAGVALPEAAQKLTHPLISCAVLANVCAAVWGHFTGDGYFSTLRAYITKVRGTCTSALKSTLWEQTSQCYSC